MKTFKDLPNLSFFCVSPKCADSHIRQKIRYDPERDVNNFNITVGVVGFIIDDKREVIEMEPCEGGFREKKRKFSELAPGTLYKHHEDAKVWKKLPNQDIAYNSIDKDGYISICCEESLVIVCEKWE